MCMKLSTSDIEKIRSYFAKQNDVVAVYLYGSFAKETTHKRSDIDVGVLFDKKQENLERLSQFYSDLCDFHLPKEPEVRNIHPNQSPLFLRNVIKGKLIYSRDEVARIRFEVAVMNKFRDTEYHRKVNYRYMKQRLQEGTYGFGPQYVT